MNNFPKRIGVTGGIGSGKSYVCRVLAAMGYPVFYSDIEAKKLINTDPELRDSIKELFGNEAYLNNELNRKHIASAAFSDSGLLSKLNALVHPKVRSAFDEWASKQDSNYVFQEAAILVETEGYKLLDKTILVTASLETKISRVKKRDKLSEEEISKRMQSQMSDSDKITFVDFVIENDDNSMILPQIKKMFKALFNEVI